MRTMRSAREIGHVESLVGAAPTAADVASRQTSEAAKPARIFFVDNVRWAMIVLVLGMHAADTYSPIGNWYYREHPAVGPFDVLFFATFQGLLQGFFMALLFFVAGFFSASSYDAKRASGFMAGRLRRLGLPTLFYVALLGPLTEFFVAHSWGGRSFPRAYGHYLASGEVFSGTGPLWFCAALIVFSGAYAVWRLVTAGAGRLPAPRPIRAWGVAAAVAALALSTFAVRLVVPMGAAVFNMQLGDFPSYILLFALGVTAARGGWLEATSARFAWRGAGVCVGAAMAMWLPLLVLGGALQGKSTVFSGGFQWQSAGLCLWESLICVGMSFAVMAAFRGRLAGQGRFCKFMSDNAFAVYVIHPPILIALALAMAGIALPPAEKFALLWVASLVASFGLAAPAARRIPLLGSILK